MEGCGNLSLGNAEVGGISFHQQPFYTDVPEYLWKVLVTLTMENFGSNAKLDLRECCDPQTGDIHGSIEAMDIDGMILRNTAFLKDRDSIPVCVFH